MKKETTIKVFLFSLIAITSCICAGIMSQLLIMALTRKSIDFLTLNSFFASISSDEKHLMIFLLLWASITCAISCKFFLKQNIKQSTTDMVKLTPGIEVPSRAGQNQHGSARFTTKQEQDKYFHSLKISLQSDVMKLLLDEGKKDKQAVSSGEIREITPLAENMQKVVKQGGIPVSYETLSSNTELIKLICGDVHSVCYGATRSGKTRTLVLQSVMLMGLSGVDMINADPKGEIYQYTNLFMQRLGYANFPLDFKNPCKSIHYNFLQFVIDAVEAEDMSKAISCCWDFVDSIVQESKTGDPLWANGEKGLLAAATMQVVYDNSTIGLQAQYPDAQEDEIAELYQTEHRFYQTCLNLFNYISKMTVQNKATGNLLLEDIIDVLPEDHPSKLIMAIAESAPSKTRGSFITSALATLRLFTDPNIAEMTSYSDNKIFDSDVKKAIYIILPDSKHTYYPLASMFVNQFYQYLSENADEKGGRLDRDFEFNLDEFGNFTKIPFFDGKMTVAAGRGIHFHLYLQSVEQLTEKYGKELASIILDNCHYLIYLRTEGPETLKMLEEKMGKYTVMSTSGSASVNYNASIGSTNTGSTSTSTQLMARSLMTHDEISKIERPYLLVLANGYPSLLQIPDLSKWSFNKMLGLGDIDFNKRLRMYREAIRPSHHISKLKLWNFVPYINELVTEKKNLQEAVKSNEQDLLSEIQNNFLDNY